MDDQLIDIARFASANEAAMARNALEAAGIPAILEIGGQQPPLS